ENDHQHAIGTEAARVVECQISQAVQPDRRLAAAGAALNHDQARVGAGDQFELAAVDERGDLFEVLVVAALLAHAEPARAVMLSRSRRGACPASQLAAVVLQAGPLAISAARERALRSAHAAQRGIDDGQTSAGDDGPGHLAVAEHLVVVVPLFIAVKQPTDRRIAPVDDADPGFAIEVGATADQNVATLAVLFQRQGTEVGRLGVDLNLGGLALTRRKNVQPLHLLEQRRHVFHARSRDLVAKIEQLRVIVRGLARLLLDTLSKMLGDLRQRALFLANDAIEIGVGFSRGGYVGHRAGGVATKKTGLGAYHAPRVESTPEPLSGAR